MDLEVPVWAARQFQEATPEVPSNSVLDPHVSPYPSGRSGTGILHQWASEDAIYITISRNGSQKWKVTSLLLDGVDKSTGMLVRQKAASDRANGLMLTGTVCGPASSDSTTSQLMLRAFPFRTRFCWVPDRG